MSGFFVGIDMTATEAGIRANVKFADAVASRYLNPLDIAQKFHSDAVTAGQAVGVDLPDVVEYSGAWVYAANPETGKPDQRQGYLAEIKQRDDGLTRPVITFNSHRSGGKSTQWQPDNLLYAEHTDGNVSQAKHDPEIYKAKAAQLAAEHAAKREVREKNDAAGRAVVAVTAAKLIEDSQDCTEHDYLTRKCIGSHGVKVAAERLRGTLYSQASSETFEGVICEAGDLIIPMYRGGEIVTAQRINASGHKLYLSGGSTSGAYYLIKGTEQGQALIAEGFATGATVSEATGRDVYVAFSAHNLKAVADAHLNIGAVAADGGDAGIKGAEATGLPYYCPPDNDIGDDWNDYAKARSLSGVAMQLTGVQMAERLQAANEEPRLHPLTRFVDISDRPEPPLWVLPNFIAEGVVVIAGGHGVGKTTVMLPTAMAVAGVHDKDYELAPKHWRHVVYITEDIHQAQRIMTGYGEHLAWNNRDIFESMKERVHIVEAQRMQAGLLVKAGAYYSERFTRTIKTIGADGEQYVTKLLPLIVIDTMAATIEMENENDNSEASKAIAALKQDFEGLPTWIIGHVAKANLGRSDSVTLRGAGAFEADANQVLYIIDDEKQRWLTRGKTRFESPWNELEIKSDQRIITEKNRFGEDEEIALRWAVAYPPEGSRSERAEQAKAERAQREDEEVKRVILANVAERYTASTPLNRTAVREAVGGRAQAVTDAIAALLADGWLYEIEIPRHERLKNKTSFLIALDEAERAEFLESGAIPEAKQYIPPSWKKQGEDA